MGYMAAQMDRQIEGAQITWERHQEAIAMARAAWGFQWPEQLTSGVMFYDGERITKQEFEGVQK